MQVKGKSVAPARLALWGAQAVAALVGLGYGFAFGQQLSGPGLGVLLAANGCVFGVMTVTGVFDLAQRLRAMAARRR